MRATTLTMRLNSPRWGHADTYEVTFDDDRIGISQGAKQAQYRPDPGAWTGYRRSHAWLAIMSNDRVYAPAAVETAMEQVWERWRDGELDDTDAQARVDEIASWINGCTGACVAGEFWMGIV